MKKRLFATLIAGCSLLTAAKAQTTEVSVWHRSKETPVNRLYWSNAIDAGVFSTANVQHTGEAAKLTTLRFTYMLNIGVNANYDFNKHIGIMAGLDIKNIGFIEKFGDSTVKRRVYTFGVPVGVKIGNFKDHNYFVLGAGADVPFNYKEKGYVSRNNKEKFNEWFSDRTPAFMPYFFAGVSLSPGIDLKFRYYPTNMLNRDYKDSEGNKPYEDFEKTNLMVFSIGVHLCHDKHDK